MERLEVGYAPISGAPDDVRHMYILYTNNSGEQQYARGGPSGPELSLNPLWGSIVTEYGAYTPNTPDWVEPGEDHRRVIVSQGSDLSGQWETITSSMDTIEAMGLRYSPVYDFETLVFDAQNSNSVVARALQDAGIPQPDHEANGVRVPGHTNILPDSCFAAGTPISVGPNGETRPIEEIAVGDEVVSYDAAGQLVTSTVTATMQNQVACVLDWFGTGVTPGHVTLCAVVEGEEDTPAGRLARPRNANDSLVGRHVPLIDILVADGAVMKQDGTLVRAATNEVVGSRADAFVRCHAYLTGEDLKAGRYVEGRMRAGAKLITGEGNAVSVLETIEANGYAFDETSGLVTKDGKTGPMPFFGPLPKPEDYVLRRSGLTLEAIQKANEWEGGQRPTVAPAAMAGAASASSGMNRKQRRAMKAKSKGRPARMH